MSLERTHFSFFSFLFFLFIHFFFGKCLHKVVEIFLSPQVSCKIILCAVEDNEEKIHWADWLAGTNMVAIETK